MQPSFDLNFQTFFFVLTSRQIANEEEEERGKGGGGGTHKVADGSAEWMGRIETAPSGRRQPPSNHQNHFRMS